jgi:hypothetical protein
MDSELKAECLEVGMDFVEFGSFNFRDRYIRHRNFLGELTRKEGPAEDFLFTLVRRGQRGEVALCSKNFPKLFLRHRDFRLRLEGPTDPNDQLFTKDSTFFLRPGLADPNGVSFESFNFRGRFIRHRDFALFVEPEDSPNLAPDATFFKEFPSVLIDPGTILVPAES